MPDRKKQSKKSRSIAARKRRQLKRVGFINRWTIGFLDFERYQIQPGDADAIETILKAVKKNHKGRRFFYGGQAEIVSDSDGQHYTNNTDQYLDADTGKIPDLLRQLDEISINPSPVIEAFTVEGLFVVIRFAKRKQ